MLDLSVELTRQLLVVAQEGDLQDEPYHRCSTVPSCASNYCDLFVWPVG